MNPSEPETSAIQHDGKLWIGFLHPDPASAGGPDSLQLTFHQKGVGCGMASSGGFGIEGAAPRVGGPWATTFRFEDGRTVQLEVQMAEDGAMHGTWRSEEGGKGTFEFWREHVTRPLIEVLPARSVYWEARILREGPHGHTLAGTMPKETILKMQLVPRRRDEEQDGTVTGRGWGHFGACTVKGRVVEDARAVLEVTFRNGIGLRLECLADGERWPGACFWGAPGMRLESDEHPCRLGSCELSRGAREW